MTPQQGDSKPSLIFRDEPFSEDAHPDEKDSLFDMVTNGLNPQVVAVICAALAASGLVGGGIIVTAVRQAGTTAPWKMAGIMDLMAARELIV